MSDNKRFVNVCGMGSLAATDRVLSEVAWETDPGPQDDPQVARPNDHGSANKGVRVTITKPGPGHTAGPVAPPADEPSPFDDDIPPPGDDQGVIPGL